MAKYQISTGIREGRGEVFINGLPIDPLGYEQGDTLNFEFVTDLTYDGILVTISRGVLPNEITNSFSFVMPARDITFVIKLSFFTEPVKQYGIKYFYDWKTVTNLDRRLEILERNYLGTQEQKDIVNVKYYWGKKNQIPIDTFRYSSVDIEVPTLTQSEYLQFLTGDIRRFQVKLFHGEDLFFVGYIYPDFLTTPELENTTFVMTLTAFDGMEAFESIRFQEGMIKSRMNLLNFPSFSQPAIKPICEALNQSFQEGRVINISCDLYETRMDQENGMFEQFAYGENAIFTDGEDPKFTADNTRQVVNSQLPLKDVLERLINPFICNVYLWENEFYVVRIGELTKNNLKFYKYNREADLIIDYVVPNDFKDDCLIVNGERNAGAVYTEFTASLDLGILLPATDLGAFNYGFSRIEWRLPTNNFNYQLKSWQYANAVVYNVNATFENINANSPRTGDIAGIQYVVEAEKEYCRIWTTTNELGINDPNLSYIERSVSNTNRSTSRNVRDTTPDEAFIPFEIANVLQIDSNWVLRKVNNSSINRPLNLFKVGFQIQVGNYYLTQNVDVFEWSLTPNIITFDVETDVNTMNNIKFQTEPIVESGELIIRLYQLIHSGGAKDLYFIDWEFFNINIAQNDALSQKEIQVKANTTVPYSKVFPLYKTFLGDSITNQSTSAMRLLNGDVTESWGDNKPLLDNIVEDLANLFGRTNQFVYGLTPRQIINPYKAVEYAGSKWMVNYMMLDEHDEFNNFIELFDLGAIPEPNLQVLVDWACFEGPPFIDANMRIYVDEEQIVEEFSNNEGTFTTQIGKTIRVQNFYFDFPFDEGVINPFLQVLVNNVVVQENPVLPNTSQTFNYTFVANQNEISILVRSIDKG